MLLSATWVALGHILAMGPGVNPRAVPELTGLGYWNR